jgi:hypothetical protein
LIAIAHGREKSISTIPLLVSQDFADSVWLKVKHLPTARLSIKRASVVHLSRVDHDYVTTDGIDPTNAAP